MIHRATSPPLFTRSGCPGAVLPSAGWQDVQCGGLRLTRVRGVPLADQNIYAVDIRALTVLAIQQQVAGPPLQLPTRGALRRESIQPVRVG